MVPRAIEDERAISENQAWKGTDIGGVDHLGERHRRNLVRQDAFSAQDPSISDKVLGARPFPKLAPQVASDYQENPDPDSARKVSSNREQKAQARQAGHPEEDGTREDSRVPAPGIDGVLPRSKVGPERCLLHMAPSTSPLESFRGHRTRRVWSRPGSGVGRKWTLG